jgi:hypothetical protein
VAQEDRPSRAVSAVRITPLDTCTELYFPPLRAPGSALMLGLFGVSCIVIGGAATSGLLHSGEVPAANFVALAFAGVFALPLVAVGLWFVVIAAWAAANSMTVEVRGAGLRVTRRVCGCAFARHEMRPDELTALELVPAPRYVGAFGSERHYRIRARAGASAVIVADNLKGRAGAAELRRLIGEKLQRPELTANDTGDEKETG